MADGSGVQIALGSKAVCSLLLAVGRPLDRSSQLVLKYCNLLDSLRIDLLMLSTALLSMLRDGMCAVGKGDTGHCMLQTAGTHQ